MTTIGKICKWTGLIVLAVLILGAVSLWLFFPVEKAKQIAIEKGTELLGREIFIETASVSFWGGIGIQLESIVIKNPTEFSNDDFLTAKVLDVKLQFFPLLFGDIAVDRLILKEPHINLLKLENGTNNFTFKNLENQVPPNLIENATPETKVATAIVTFENVELQSGTLHYQDDSAKTELTLTGLDLHTTLTHSQDNQYLSSGELEIRSIQVDSNLSIPEINLSLKYESLYNPLANSILISKADLVLNGVATRISASIENIFSDIKAKLNMQSEHEDVLNLLTFVPSNKKDILANYQFDGNLSFDVDVEYSLNEFLYFGTVTLQDISVMHDSLPGKFLCREALVDIKNDNLRFNIKEGEFDGKPIKGYVTIDNFNDPFINGALAGTLNLKYLEPFLPEGKNHTLNGIANFDVKTSGRIMDKTNLKVNGVVQSNNLSYNSSFMLEPIDSSTLEIYFDNEIISIKQLTATTQSGSFSLDGRVTSLLQYLLTDSSKSDIYNPTINAKLKADLQLSLLNKILPPKGNPVLRGDLSVDLQLSGSINNVDLFKPFGEISIKNGFYSDELLPENINNFDAKLTILPDTIIVHSLQANFETSDVQFKGKLINPFPYLLPLKNLNRQGIKKPLFIFSVKSNRFDADKLFPEAVPGVADENKVTSIDSVSTLILPDIDGRGTFVIDTLIYSQVELTALHGNISIENKKIECYDVVGNAYSGKIEGNTTIDLNDFNNPHYDGAFNAIQIEVNDFANRFSKFQNIIYGKVDMKGTYSATGWEPEQFLNSMTMNSTSNISQGKIILSDEFLGVSNSFFKKFDSSMHKEQTIRNLFTNIIVKNGAVSFDKLTAKFGDIGDLEFGGFYNYNGAIAYDGKIKCSKELTNKIVSKLSNVTSQNNLLNDISSFLTKKTSIGQITLPLHIGGTLEKPEFKIDVSSVFKK